MPKSKNSGKISSKRRVLPSSTSSLGESLKSSKSKSIQKDQRKLSAKPGTVELRELRSYKESEPIFIKSTIQKEIKEICANLDKGFKMQEKAKNAIMQAAEEYLVEVFKNANKFTVHDNRDTLMVEDMQKAISE